MKVATPIGALTKSEACATTDGMPEACATSAGKSEVCANTHDGRLVSITGDKLVMSDSKGKDYSHTVASDAKVCCDGVACKPENLKVGSKIRLTTKSDDKLIAVKIESLDKRAEYAQTV